MDDPPVNLMLTDLERLVRCESPSSAPEALRRCADLLAEIGSERLGEQPICSEADAKPILYFGPPDPTVLPLGHLDTVHLRDTIVQAPCQVEDGRVYGPGVFDMKAGLVQAVHAVDTSATPDTTVTPTVASAGTTSNTVPDRAELLVDVRAMTAAEQERVDLAMRSLVSDVPAVRIEVLGGINRPPLDPDSSARLLNLAHQVGAELGLPPLTGVHVGGGSDGNFTAGLGIDTLDGLGAVGDRAHTRYEWAEVAALVDRTRLVSGLADRIVAEQAVTG